MASLDCLRPMAMMVGFSQSPGKLSPVALGILSMKGALFLTRPTLMTYTAKRQDLIAHAQDLFAVVQKGIVDVKIRQRYPLAEAARAHRNLEARKTAGSTIFVPG